MDPTTLVTFLFNAPPEARIVELLGSWDNFAQPYQMHHDRRRGKGFWSGCFRFNNIIFDGDTSFWSSKPRSGGLKQGGMYWYYYRLDYDVETYDDSREWTANCPLLPGQFVNVMDVPVEIVEPPSRRRSAGFCEIEGTLASWSSRAAPVQQQTMEPSDKFAMLEPPPVSEVHGKYISDLALNGRLERRAPSPVRSIVSPLETSSGEKEQQASPPEDRPSRSARAGEHDSRPCLRRKSNFEARSCSPSSIIDAYHAEPCDGVNGLESLQSPINNLSPPARSPYDGFNFDCAPNCSVRDDALSAVHETEEFDSSSEVDYHSALVHNTYTNSSRPGTHHSDKPWQRPRSNSRPTTSYSNQQSQQPHIYLEPETYCLNHPNLDPSVERQAEGTSFTRGDSYPASDKGDSAASDIWSPTFSAATVSSSGGGLNTPFRLSDGYSHGSTAYRSGAQALEHVVEKLQSLDAGSAHRATPQDYQSEPSFKSYALPHSASDIAHSPIKSPSPKTSISHYAPQSMITQETTSRSMADDIFSELGYLGASIA